MRRAGSADDSTATLLLHDCVRPIPASLRGPCCATELHRRLVATPYHAGVPQESSRSRLLDMIVHVLQPKVHDEGPRDEPCCSGLEGMGGYIVLETTRGEETPTRAEHYNDSFNRPKVREHPLSQENLLTTRECEREDLAGNVSHDQNHRRSLTVPGKADTCSSITSSAVFVGRHSSPGLAVQSSVTGSAASEERRNT
jgi:hypothetical protein